jgi:hypothetical protein
MTTTAGLLLVNQVMPLIMAAIARGAVRPTGCEDTEELQAEGCALAAAMLDSAEARGKAVAPSSIAYYAVQALKSGCRSYGAGRQDALSPAAALDRSAKVQSMDEGIGSDENDPDHELTLHDCLAGQTEDADVAAARRLDWEPIMGTLDDRRRSILMATADGRGVNEIAAACKVSAPRVCQIRESIGEYIAGVWGGNGLVDVARPSKWRRHVRAAAERRACRAARAWA